MNYIAAMSYLNSNVTRYTILKHKEQGRSTVYPPWHLSRNLDSRKDNLFKQKNSKNQTNRIDILTHSNDNQIDGLDSQTDCLNSQIEETYK